MLLSGTCGDRNVDFAVKGLKKKSVCLAKSTLRLVQGWKRESTVGFYPCFLLKAELALSCLIWGEESCRSAFLLPTKPFRLCPGRISMKSQNVDC